jgi:hypothetical protein
VETPLKLPLKLPSNSPHEHMILRVDLSDVHDWWAGTLFHDFTRSNSHARQMHSTTVASICISKTKE